MYTALLVLLGVLTPFTDGFPQPQRSYLHKQSDQFFLITTKEGDVPQRGKNQLFIHKLNQKDENKKAQKEPENENENTEALGQQKILEKKSTEITQQEGKLPKRRSSQILSPWLDRFHKIKQAEDDKHKEAPKQQELMDKENEIAPDKKEHYNENREDHNQQELMDDKNNENKKEIKVVQNEEAPTKEELIDVTEKEAHNKQKHKDNENEEAIDKKRKYRC